MHDAVDEHFPELAHLIKWHLCAADTGPTHYEADALYHWEQGARKHFESTVVFRALDSDVMGFKHCENEEDKELQLEYIRDWLAERLPFLLMIMHEELTEAGVPELNHSDIGWRVA